MNDQGSFWLSLMYIATAAVAGAVTALSFLKWKELSATEIALTVFVGFSFAVFVTPWVAHVAFGLDTGDVRAVAGLTYISASGSNSLLPALIRWVSRRVEGEAKK